MSHLNQNIETNLPPEAKGRWTDVKRWLKRFVIAFVIFNILIIVLFQLPPVQRWAVKTTSGFLSTQLKTKVNVGEVSVRFFDILLLKEVYVEDYLGDTLLYSKVLRADLNSGPISWFQKKLSFDDIQLSDTYLRLFREDSTYFNNFNQLINGLKKKKGGNNDFQLSINDVLLKNFHLNFKDIVRGETQDYRLRYGKVSLEEIDLEKSLVKIKKGEITSPQVAIEQFKFGTRAPKPARMLDSNYVQKLFRLEVEQIEVVDGEFHLDNLRHSPVKTTPDHIFDPAHIYFQNIFGVLEDITFYDQKFSGKLNHVALNDLTGLEIVSLSSDSTSVSPTGINFLGMNLETPNSKIGDTLILKYKSYDDFSDFNNKVRLVGNFNNSSIAIQDIMVFSPALQKNAFFIKNKQEVLDINGILKGRINRLRSKDLDIKLARGIQFTGDFNSRNIAIRNDEYFFLEDAVIKTSMKTLNELIPDFAPPTNFNKLGKLNFKGSFNGFIEDFVAEGDLLCDLGRANMNMRLDVKNGKEKAIYEGKLNLVDFDLKTWTGNEQMGNITLSSDVSDGKGLTVQSANATLKAKIENVSFRDYTYENIVMNGTLERNLFDGKLEIQDDNIDFNFAGNIDFTDSIPEFDFQAKIDKLDLKKLNFSKHDLVISGDVKLDLLDKNLANMQGLVKVSDLKIVKDKEESFLSDSIEIKSEFDQDLNKSFTVQSDLFNAALQGHFNIDEIPQVFENYFLEHYPEFLTRFGVKDTIKSVQTSDFNFDLEINDLKNFTHLLSPRLDSVKEVSVRGYYRSEQEQLKINAIIPSLNYQNWAFEDISLKGKLTDGQGNLDLAVSKSVLNDRMEFSPIVMLGLMQRDTYEFSLSSFTPILNTVDNLNLNGKFFLEDDAYRIEFLPSNLVIWQQQWDIEEDNFIKFGNNRIETRKFEFLNSNKFSTFQRSIRLESFSERGLKAQFTNFDLSFINETWNYDRLNFGGNFEINAVVQDIFNLNGITALAKIDEVNINGDNFGVGELQMDLQDLKSPMNVQFDLQKDSQLLSAQGTYFLPAASKTVKKLKKRIAPNYFDVNVNLEKYPLDILEYFIIDGVSNTKGSVDAQFALSGTPAKPGISGTARVYNGQTKINYLNTTYFIKDEKINLSNYSFDATGRTLRDKFGNTASVTGGITHDHLSNFGLNLRVKSSRFLLLDTKKRDNPTYYGTGIGSGDIRFSGDFKRTNIDIIAKTGVGSELSMPITYEQNASEVRFIRFKDKNTFLLDEDDSKNSFFSELKGINLNMALEITEAAKMKLIFDERHGDVIQGQGNGNIQIKILRDGEFSMIGDYIISRGEYLFTLLNLINKPFVVKEGGTISWTGDPLNAEINLEAEYENLNAAVYNLIQEYLNLLPEDIKREASRPAAVNLTMLLKGQLLRPDIEFDINFPSLTNDLRNYVDTKLRQIKEDPNELNRQVFGLIVMGQFLPSSYTFSGTQITINTLTELLANQLSLYFSEVLSQIVKDVNFISGIDFNFSYNYYENELSIGNEIAFLSGQELQNRIKLYLFDDKLTVNSGFVVNLDPNRTTLGPNSNVFQAGDITLEYAISEDRRLKLRAYVSTEPHIEGGQKFKAGSGISHVKEFDSLEEFLNGIKESTNNLDLNQ